MNIPNLYQPTPEKLQENGIYSTRIDGLFYIAHATHGDSRGFFAEIARFPEVEAVTGVPFNIRQINHARSQKNVIRGIHTENWNKYITITSGICFSAIVDVRPESKTFGEKEFFLLGIGEGALDGSLFIPARSGNSMCVVEGPVDYLYFVDRLYKDRDTSGDLAISLFDPELNIPWPVAREDMVISERDLKAVTMKERFGKK